VSASHPAIADERRLERLELRIKQREETAMAMTINGEVQLPASRELVWSKLNEPDVLRACIPGCEELEKTSDNEFRATTKMKIGPVSARFKGRATLSDFDPPNSYKISGEGEGGVAGFAKGGAVVRPQDKDGGTLLTYDVDAQIGGKLAQLGQRLISGSAKKLADEFFTKFAEAVRIQILCKRGGGKCYLARYQPQHQRIGDSDGSPDSKQPAARRTP
jgi:carbon monoxide dehydrogenase subunit G